MNSLILYSKNKLNYLSIAKLNILSLNYKGISFQKLILYFHLNPSVYTKSVVFIFIIVSLVTFGSFYTRLVNDCVKVGVSNLNSFMFLYSFVHYYLPNISNVGDLHKVMKVQKNLISCFRATYKSFPLFFELDCLNENFPLVSSLMNHFKFQIDFFINDKLVIGYSEFLLRFLRLPYLLVYTNIK